MTVAFIIAPEVLPVAEAGDLVARIFVNRSFIPSGAKLLPDGTLTGTRVGNVSRVGAHPALRVGTSVDLTGTKVTNTSAIGAAPELALQGATGNLRATKVTNTSSIGAGPELAVQGAPGYLRATKVTNTSSFGSSALSADESGGPLDGGDDMIGGAPTGGVPS